METNQKIELGEFYKEMRIARKVKQKDVVGNKLSVSQLSKFESGQTMLSADKMLDVIEGINMTFAEFGLALKNYQPSEYQKLVSKIVYLTASNNLNGLLKLLEEQETDDKLYSRLNQMIIKSAIHGLNSNSPLEKDDIQFLTNYLYDIENWTGYELHLFGNTMAFLSNLDLIYLGKELIRRAKVYRSLTHFRRALKQIYINLISEILERGITTEFHYFVDELRNQLDVFDTFETLTLEFLVAIYNYKYTKRIQLSDIEFMIQQISELNLEPLALVMKQRLKVYGIELTNQTK